MSGIVHEVFHYHQRIAAAASFEPLIIDATKTEAIKKKMRHNYNSPFLRNFTFNELIKVGGVTLCHWAVEAFFNNTKTKFKELQEIDIYNVAPEEILNLEAELNEVSFN